MSGGSSNRSVTTRPQGSSTLTAVRAMRAMSGARHRDGSVTGLSTHCGPCGTCPAAAVVTGMSTSAPQREDCASSKRVSHRARSDSRCSRAARWAARSATLPPVLRERAARARRPRALGARDLRLDELELRSAARASRRAPALGPTPGSGAPPPGRPAQAPLRTPHVAPPSRRGTRRARGPRSRAAGRRRRRGGRGRARRAGTVPGTPRARPRAPRASSRSRWLVGSSRTRRFAPDATRIASASRPPLAAREHRDRLLVLVPSP